MKRNLARRLHVAGACSPLAIFVSACNAIASPVLDPKGPIAAAQTQLLLDAVAIMMIVIVPVFIMAALFTWRYRGTNRNARYAPNLAYYWPVEILIWGVPAGIIFWLGLHLWSATHRLDPYKPIDPEVPPLRVEAVAQDWKWLFIYPEQDIAVVNELVFPAGRPLALRITSDTVMNSFMIPGLGGQIYAMAGMQTRLHLLADEPGEFWGRNVQYSGRGFADQQFRAIATTTEGEFGAWVEKVKASTQMLDATTYEQLAKPSVKVPVTYYSGVQPGLFDSIIAKWHGDGNHLHAQVTGTEQAR